MLSYFRRGVEIKFGRKYLQFGECHSEFMNVKLARDVISRSTLRLKGKSCNGENSENYINARNRKVYTMIELHGVGLLAEGQSASRWRFEFFLPVTRGEQLHWHFLHFVEILDFWRGLYFRRKKHHRKRNICDTDFFDKVPSCKILSKTINKYVAIFLGIFFFIF